MTMHYASSDAKDGGRMPAVRVITSRAERKAVSDHAFNRKPK
jgi:hypothetical protein